MKRLQLFNEEPTEEFYQNLTSKDIPMLILVKGDRKKVSIINSVNGFIGISTEPTFEYYFNEDEYRTANSGEFVNLRGEEYVFCGEMFAYHNDIISLDLSNFKTFNVKNMGYMFSECIALTTLDASNFDTSNVTEMEYMFSDCPNLTSIKCNKSFYDWCMLHGEIYLPQSMLPSGDGTWIVDGVEHPYEGTLTPMTFRGVTSSVTYWIIRPYGRRCNSGETITVYKEDFGNYMGNMFNGSTILTSLDLSNFDTSNVTNMYNMFNNCTSLITLDISNFNTSKVMYMHYMFQGCRHLTALNVSSFDTSNVKSMSYMFSGCRTLTTLDLSNWDMSKVANMSQMFTSCSKLTDIYMRNCSDDTISKIQSALNSAGILSKVTIHTD